MLRILPKFRSHKFTKSYLPGQESDLWQPSETTRRGLVSTTRLPAYIVGILGRIGKSENSGTLAGVIG